MWERKKGLWHEHLTEGQLRNLQQRYGKIRSFHAKDAIACYDRVRTHRQWQAIMSCLMREGGLELPEAAKLASSVYASSFLANNPPNQVLQALQEAQKIGFELTQAPLHKVKVFLKPKTASSLPREHRLPRTFPAFTPPEQKKGLLEIPEVTQNIVRELMGPEFFATVPRLSKLGQQVVGSRRVTPPGCAEIFGTDKKLCNRINEKDFLKFLPKCSAFCSTKCYKARTQKEFYTAREDFIQSFSIPFEEIGRLWSVGEHIFQNEEPINEHFLQEMRKVLKTVGVSLTFKESELCFVVDRNHPIYALQSDIKTVLSFLVKDQVLTSNESQTLEHAFGRIHSLLMSQKLPLSTSMGAFYRSLDSALLFYDMQKNNFSTKTIEQLQSLQRRLF